MGEAEDNQLEQQPEEAEEGPPSGFDELLYALSGALLDKRTKGAIAKLVENYAAELPFEHRRRFQAMLWSYAFTLVVMAAIGLLGWLKVINGETAGTLLGGIVGAVFGRAAAASQRG